MCCCCCCVLKLQTTNKGGREGGRERVCVCRLLGFVYSAAFLIVALQGRALIGVDGLTPVPLHQKLQDLPLQGWFFTLFGWGNRSLELLGWSGLC